MRKNVSMKLAYLRGLLEGLGYEKKEKEGKVFYSILDILDEMQQEIEMQSPGSSAKENTENNQELLNYTLNCPNCKKTVTISEQAYLTEQQIHCPNCGANIPIEKLEDEFDYSSLSSMYHSEP